MGRITLLNNVESQLGKLSEQQCETVAHSVLYHLWRRMPHHERERMLSALPLDIKALLMEPKSPKEPRLTDEQRKMEGPIEYESYEAFCSEIREEAELAGDGQDEDAIHAVFGALKVELPEEEVMHIEERLPKALQQVWAVA